MNRGARPRGWIEPLRQVVEVTPAGRRLDCGHMAKNNKESRKKSDSRRQARCPVCPMIEANGDREYRRAAE